MNDYFVSPLFFLQILLLTLPVYGQAEQSIVKRHSQTHLTYRVVSTECRTLDTSIVVWSDADRICVHTVDREAPDVISHFVSITRNKVSTDYFLAEPVYTDFSLESFKSFPSISYLLISLNPERVGVGSIEFVFKNVQSLEKFDFHFITGTLPSRLTFTSSMGVAPEERIKFRPSGH